MSTGERMLHGGKLTGRRWLGLVTVAMLVLVVTAGLVDSAGAATRYVATSGNNGGNSCLASGAPCKTITHALSQAVADDTISVAAGTYNLALGETFPLTISMDLTLAGAGAGSTILDATGANQRVITIAAGPVTITVTITGVTTTGGRASCTSSFGITCGATGGGIGIEYPVNTDFTIPTLILTNSTVSGNTASCTTGGGFECRAAGGGISGANVILTNSTVSGNTASCTASFGNCTLVSGGGLSTSAVGGAVTLTNVTVTGNTVSCTASFDGSCANDTEGGGISVSPVLGPVTLTNVTVSGNTGGGIHNLDNTQPTTLLNTVVAKQLTGPDCSGFSVTSLGHNLSSDTSCGFSGPGDLNNVDPKLGPLQNNGGPTQTHALLPGSPAIDAGTSTGCPATDQRGITRPQGSACDIGAFEVAASTGPGPAARQLLHVATFVGPTVPPTPQQQQQAFRTTDPILAGATYYDPNPACLGVPPAGVKFFVFTLEGHLTLGRNRDTTGGISSTQIGTSNYQALLATLGPGVLPPGTYNAVFWVTDCTNTAILVSEFAALQVLGP